jgi:shikimate kinase
MGSGKSYWGRIWADKFNLRFIDLDELIEKQSGQTILEIFDKEGETAFRHLEKKLLENLVTEKNIIIACGGGTPCFFDNMQLMNNHGTTVYLKATVEQILSRVLGELHKRPMLKNLNDEELKSFIDDKMKERDPYYSQATITIPVDELNENSIHSFLKS